MRAHLCQRRPSHPENPQKSCKSCFRQSAQSLVNSRHRSSNAHAGAPVPTSPLPSRKSPIIMQILLQTVLPISRQTLVISRTTLIRALMSSRLPRHPENPHNSCKSSFNQSAQSLVISRTTLVRALICSRRISTCPHPQLFQARPPPKRHLLS